MKHALFSALLMLVTVPAIATPVTYDFDGELNQVIMVYTDQNPLLPTNPDPQSPLVVNGMQLLNGNALVTGSITFDPAYEAQPGVAVPVPVAFTFTLEGFTVTHTIAYSPFDTFNVSATSMQTHLESNMQSTGALFPGITDIDLNFQGGNLTGGTFDLHGLTDSTGEIQGGSLIGTLSPAAPVGVPEPGEFALMAAGLASSIWITMRRRATAVLPRQNTLRC